MSAKLPDLSDLGACLCGHFDIEGCRACNETRRRMEAYGRARWAEMTPTERAAAFSQTIEIKVTP